jgi:UV DNA damage endonuclease
MIGYCCINMTLDRCVNRTMRKATFTAKGLEYVGELALKNLDDMLHILHWNVDNDILIYRMSSDMFPWMSEYDFTDLPNFQKILWKCQAIGKYADKHGVRLSFHPGPFNVLGSNNSNVVDKTIDELTKHAQIMDIMDLSQSHYNPINIHVSATKPSKEQIAKQFCANFKRLPQTVKSRLTVENDDKIAQYTPKDLYDLIHTEIGIPLTFDQFHFQCGNQDTSLREALELSLGTWNGVKPLTHTSSSKRVEFDDDSIKATAHADFIYEPIQTFGHDFDTDLEAKQKDKAVLDYRKKFG